MDHRPLPRPRLTPSAGPFHIREEDTTVWINILSGAIQLTLEAWMQMSEWMWF